jgi:hypothetical protein
VIFDAKARWRHFLDTFEAFFELEDLTANAAQKVMMMALVRTFVAWRLARNFHRDDTPVFRQRFEGPVNGCQSDRRHFLQGESMDFGRGERVVMASQDGLDGPFLAGASIHFSIVVQCGYEINVIRRSGALSGFASRAGVGPPRSAVQKDMRRRRRH